MSTLEKLWHVLTPDQRWTTLGLVCLMLIGMAMEMLGIGLIIPLLTLMMREDLAGAYPGLTPWLNAVGNPSHDELVIAGMLTLVGIYAVKAIYLGFLAWRQAHFVFGFQAELSQRLFAGYVRQPYTFHLQRNSAQLIRNIVGQVDEVRWVLQVSLLLATEGCVLLGVVALLLAVEPLGTVLVAGILSLAVWGFHGCTRDRILRLGQARQLHEGLRLQYLQEGLGSVKEMKILGRESGFLDQYWVHNAGNAQVGRRQATVQALPRLWLELLVVIGLALLVFVMMGQDKPIGILVPTLGLFGAAALRLMPSVNRMLSSVQYLRFFRAALDNLHGEIKLLCAVQAPKEPLPLPFKHGLEIEQVSFRYPSAEAQALCAVSLVIPRGSSAGFIGKTGAGKSTLVDIILGLLIPTSGGVKVDGSDIQTNLRGWQGQIGYVPQTIYLTDDTLRRNVALGLPDDRIDEHAVMRAIAAAQLEQFIKELPQGLDTMVGERGVRLSGGQRQRIGIARALYHDPPVLVLDEATSSLDTATERGVIEAVKSLKGHKTLLIVAHRLSTVEHCDRLFCLEQGRVVDEGETAVILEKVAAVSPELSNG